MKRLAILLWLNLLFSMAWAQTSYYVSPSGDDNNSGTSPSEPWQSIQQAVDAATHGDTIFLMDGVFAQQTIYIVDKRTSSSDYLVIRNYPGQTPIIDGANLSSDPQLFYIENSNNIVIQGLKLQNNQRNNAAGFEVEGNCQNIKILDNEITQINFSDNPDDEATSSTNAYPIIFYAYDGDNPMTGIVVSGNMIHDCRTGYSEGIAVNGNVDGFEISNNLIYNMTNIGIDAIGFEGTAPSNDFARNGVIKNNVVHDCVSPYAACGGIYIDGGQSIVVENNVSYNNQYGIEVGNEHAGTTTQNIIVRNNVFYSNQNMGILVGGYNGQVQYVTVTGNTTYGNNTGGEWGAELYFSEKCSDITVKNNIFFANNSQNIIVLAEGADTEPPNITLDYNLYYSADGESSTNFDWFGADYDGTLADFQASGHDPNSFFSDPLLIDPQNADFHLTASSPAINAGDPNYTPATDETDIDGDPRLIGGRIDMGADEFNGSTSLVTKLDGVSLYPNPARDYLVLRTERAIAKVQLFSTSGRLLNCFDFSSDRLILDLRQYPTGVYLLKLSDNSGWSQTVRFVKY